ncbi:3-hydroxyacyl-ACP dehydratase FabZ [Paenarthrobacter nitroguajacolicus]|uniref:3-hydroxyacyl-ACP dehydratase FabZ n=1 Tax=Paenarthrobacter nitroguajacolicus TaxID=211146 RepID=UPI003431EE85
MSIALKASDILARLPHRHPLVLLDRVEDLNHGKSATGIKNITISDPVFQGHFPNNPVYPGVYMIEASAQLCGLLLGSPTGEDGPVLGYLASVRKFKFITPVYPGDVLSIQARAGVSHANLADFSVDIKVSGKIVASGSLALARIDPDPST